MANDAVLQVRIDSQLKSEVEELYRQMGTTFSEAVRLFARQSLIRRRLPFEVSESDSAQWGQRQSAQTPQRAFAGQAARAGDSGFAMFASYANPQLHAREETAWQDAVAEKHAASAKAPRPSKRGDGKAAKAR